ncbi:hypothetical protein BDP81DRAFT_471828, partial [Colletotrichum phormii]
MASLPEEPIAIIGSACRFPGGCSSPSKLWELLREPHDVRKQFDPKRLNLERFHNVDGQTHGSTDVRGLSYLLEEDSRIFDAGFSSRGSQTSVHVGSMSNDYGVIQARDPETMPKYNATGAHAPSIIANRVSYVLDLKGPSVTIDTACSSSLVALHQAVQGLRAGDCDAAIVGGTNLIMDPGPYIAESKLQMLSPDSQCRMWDASANGYGRGEGVAALLLKPLAKALADGDPVQGVVRATGINSDGQSPGITMPFAPAQTDLIRRTYRRAGLDPLREADRPQYFECHGTGTQAGDPVEARAVYDVFFGGQEQESQDQAEKPEKTKPETLIVGSIKTIIGHTEGCAGLAGVIKVLLMLKHQTVPPNMLFNQLNPKIAPYYGPGALKIVNKIMAWPARPAGTPMRASVNSFGFGGTNAHAIIEALPGVAEVLEERQQLSDGAVGPLLFSAQSGPALLRNVQAYLEYVETHANSLDLRDLSRILQTHRSTHRVRSFFTGGTRQDVLDAMGWFVMSHAGEAKNGDIGTVPRLINPAEAPGIPGVFTGQGAQWATMGRGLMAVSPLFRRSLEACDAVLQHGLPAGHGHAPSWSLIDELSKEADTSRLGEAELAQPLCTALQIAQVDILTASGIRLDAVVGHSSGEIAATYAAGLITREAAVQIAYYRGFYAHLARAGTKVGGGMLAVGLSLPAASELCRQPAFVGRLVVAASNAPQSCTLSGDRDAVAEAKEQLERDNIFARLLVVDTAYHSHHMAACADAYLQALLACDISVKPGKGRGRGACVWSSSVRGDARLVRRGGEAELLSKLKGPYWVANMVQMVKFSQALESAVWHGGRFDLAIELGSHPALKGPVEQTLKAAYGSAPPYASLLKRKMSDVAVVQEAVGSSLLADLPGYAWDHDRVYWRESRISARYRTLADTAHELLGRRMPDDNDHELRWRNVLRLSEIPWLKGHEILREVLLPGAAYVSIAAQAAQYVAGSRPVAQLAVEDVDILRPVVVPDNTDGVETLFTVQVLPAAVEDFGTKNKAAQVVRAKFAYYVCPNEVTGAMMHTCSGNLVIHIGPADSGYGPTSAPSLVLPPREPIPDNAVHVDGEAIHEMFGQIGLDYHDAFAATNSCERVLGYAAATAMWPASSKIDIEADAASLGPSSSSYVLHPVMGLTLPPRDPTQDERTLRVNEATERLTLWYIRQVVAQVEVPPPSSEKAKEEQEIDGLQWHHRRMLEAFAHHLELVHHGKHPLVQTAWLTDGPEEIAALDREHGTTVEFRLMRAVGGALARVVQGESHLLLQVMQQDDLLNQFYMQNNTSVATNRAVGQLMKQIAFKFPRCNMLEIGAGTGGTTWSVLHAVDDLYDSYTFTDVSPAFFSAAAEKFSAFDRVAYRTLDIEQDVAVQGFTPYSYDVVIAANVLHATRSLADTLARARSLLRPGGYLVLLETTGTQSMVGFLFGGLPGWWQSTEPSRRYGPTVPALEWHRLLCRAGFSGADTVLHDSPDESRHVTSCIVSQAVDEDVLRLRSPLDFVAPTDLPAPSSAPLLLIGGQRLATTRVVDQITRMLPTAWRSRLCVIPSIDDIDLDDVSLNRADVLCLHDADQPLFANLPMSETRLRRLRHLFLSAASLLWVTASGTSAAPRASMIRGITRVVPKEIPHLSVQVLGLEAGAGPAVDARRCVEAFLRLRHIADLRDSEGQTPLPLWSVEPECEVLVDGEVRIPRVMPATALNERFAARNRPIVKTVDVTDVAVQAVANVNGKMELRRFVDHSQGAVQMDVEYALHVPSHHEESSVFIVHGRLNEDWVMAISSSNVSKLSLQPKDIVRVGCSYTPASIKAVADALLRRALIHRVVVNAGLTVGLLLFEPQYNMAEKLEKELKAELKGVSVEVHCVTSNSNLEKVPRGWIRVHANMSRRMAKQCLPSNRVDFFVDCSETSEHAYHQAWGHLKESLPFNCQAFALDGELLQRFLPRQLEIQSESQNQAIEALFASAGVAANSTGEGCDKTATTIMAADLAGMNAASLSRQQYLCSWHQQYSLPLTIQPPETDIHPNGLLRPDLNYLIMGGSGGLGLSLTRWMIHHGAQHMVITSRRAQPNADLQTEALHAGAKVHTLALDVTQRAEVETAVATIRSTMPPITGVCNLSMVLHDAVFLDMSPQQLNETLAAKVVGTENLDAVFHGGKGAEQLDFFIVTSSAASTIGNVAQANYHAGNLFMNAVVAGRRARGLAASVVHIGSIRLTPLSETDVQDAFAMAVRASRVDSSPGSGSELEHDITMGLAPPTAPMQAGQVNKAVWTLDPRLMALKPYSALSTESQQQQKDQHGSGGAGVREQVARAETEDGAVAAVAAAFGAKLETMLQLPKGAVHESNGLERPIVDLGIDSLVAVEIRTWFLKELDTEVPIVKILGGETVLEVSAKAAKKMLADRKEIPPKSEEKKEIKAVEKVVQASSEVVKQTPGATPVPVVVTPISVDSNLASTGNSSSSSSSSIVENSGSGSDTPKTATTDDEEEEGEHPDQPKDDPDLKKNDVLLLDPVIVREAPMSAAQSRFWFVHKHSDNPAACKNAFYYRLRGHSRVNPAWLRHALRLVAARHECLRTCYYPRLEDGHPMQGITAPSESAVRLTHTEYDDRGGIDTALRETLEGFKTRAWDLERGETMEVSLLSIKNGQLQQEDDETEEYGYLVLGYHHITLDSWSVALFWRDVDRAYRMQPLTPIGRGLSYVDYSLHQLSEEENGALDEDLAFWRAEFASSLPDTLPLLPMARGLDRSSLVRQQQQRISAHNLDQEFNPAQLEAVKSLSQRLRISPFHVHLALLQVLLARLTGTEDICIGVVDANRRDERFVNTLGCFVNMLPLRATVAATAGATETSPDFASIARAASRKAMSVFAHGTLPLDRILSLASAPRATEAHPLFQAAIIYRTAGGGGIDIWDLTLGSDDARMELSWHGAKEAENPYDVSLGFFEMPGGGCLAQIWCSATLYGPEACRSLMDVYLRLLEAVAREPEVSVDRLALYDDSDARVLRALEVGRGPETKFDWVDTASSLCLSRRVRDMCRLHPERIAVTDAVGSLSYSQLANQTSRLTHRLKEAGAHARHVAVLCEPSVDGIVAMLAVLEAGAVYVPLDVSLPASRHADMLRLCEPALVLFHTQTEQRLNALLDDVVVGEQHEKPRALQVDVDHPQDDSNTHGDLDNSNKISPAFLLFTSGSTGTPNGVHLTQLNFANHIALKTQTFSLAHTDRVLQQSSLGFDMALVQTFSALANEACLVIAPADIRRDPVAIAALLRREAVSITIATPTEYLAWIHAAADSLSASTEATAEKGDGSSTWRLAFSGGEQIPPRLITELGRLGIPGLRLTNCYGPTEITAATTFQPIPLDNDDQASSTSCAASPNAPSAMWRPYAVGKALLNYTVIIVDPFSTATIPQPLPLGQTGEICIGGAGVALGYLNRPDLTRARFLTDVPGMKEATVYRTGDKGRLLADGTLLCLGRLDGNTQIKLRGQRVDLQEIEAAVLQASAGALASVVVSRRRLDGAGAGGVGEDDILIAHATLADDVDPTTWQDDNSISSSSSILSRVRLSQAFIPAAIYTLKTLPSTPNGKLDRKAIARLRLPLPGRKGSNPNHTLGSDTSATNTEETPGHNKAGEKLTVRQGELRLLWERVLPSLGSKRIGPSSDFFLCGGNSLLLMKLQKAIKETTGVEISTKRMYEAITLRAMTRAVFEDSTAAAAEENARIDWDAETAVPGWLREEIGKIETTTTNAAAADAIAVKKGKTESGIEVLLTGASSFPGSHILTALLHHPSIRKVHCIAVPSDHHHQPSPSSHSASVAEVVYYTGTLLSKTLGLTPTERNHLAQTVHIIVHTAAHGHCLNRFATLRRPNLEALHSLASLNPKPLPLKPAYPPPSRHIRDPQTSIFPPRLPSTGRGRIGRVHGESCTLVSPQAPNSDAMNGILRYSLAMRTVPRLRRAEGFVDFAPLDDVVGRIAAAAVELAGVPPSTSTSAAEASPPSSSIHFRHHSGGIKTLFSQFRAHMETVYGGAFDEVDMQEWLVRAARQGLDPLITAYIEALLESGMPLVSPYLGAE